MSYLNKKILGIIPARGGSKGISKKNISLLGGKPLISWVWEAASKSELIDEIVLSSDSDEIIDIAMSMGISSPFKRPAYLGGDKTLIVDVIHHMLTWYRDHQEKRFDFVCLIQPTSPLAITDDYERAIRKAVSNDADTVFSVYQADQQLPLKLVTINKNEEVEWYKETNTERMSRRQDLEVIYKRCGIVYVFKVDLILNKKTLYGDKVFAINVPKVRGMVDVNDPIDLTIAEILINNTDIIGNKGT